MRSYPQRASAVCGKIFPGKRNSELSRTDKFCSRIDVSLNERNRHIRSSVGVFRTISALSLWALHHRLSNKTAFTVSPGRLVIMARNVGGRGFEEALGRFGAKPLAPPVEAEDAPDPRFAAWHAREVFNSPRLLVGTQQAS